MPAWITHFVVAEKVCHKLNIKDKNSFLFGNIVPDILNNHFVKETNVHKNYGITHFSKFLNVNGINCEFPDLDKFWNEYEEKMNNPILFGCFVHLATDYYWNMNFRTLYTENENGVTALKLANGEKIAKKDDNIVKIKHRDFKIFTDYLKKNNKLEKIIYTDELFELCKELKEIPLTKKDIFNTLEIVNDMIESNPEEFDDNYSIYTLKDMNKYFNESIDFILSKLGK